MKKTWTPIMGIITLIVIFFAAILWSQASVRNYQEDTRAYVYGAWKNGAITADECASLMAGASSFHCYPEVRYRRAMAVRKAVDRAYEEQKRREVNK